MFLRKLEYYNGILFLTTNRIGKVDQAISSRVHLILHYKRLGLPAIEKIFLINIRNLEEMEQQHHEASGQPPLYIVKPEIVQFAIDHFHKYPNGKGAWNGRQIRNAFLVAASLARHEVAQPGMEGRQPQLRYAHFQEVEKLTREYNQFRARVIGGDDARKARLLEERDDDYEGEGNEQSYSARPGASPSPGPSGHQSPHNRGAQRTHAASSSNGGPLQWGPTPAAPRIQVGVHPDWAVGHAQAGYGETVIRPAAHGQAPLAWQAPSTSIHAAQVPNQPPQGYTGTFQGGGAGQVNYFPVRSAVVPGHEQQAAPVPGAVTSESQTGFPPGVQPTFGVGGQNGGAREART